MAECAVQSFTTIIDERNYNMFITKIKSESFGVNDRKSENSGF